jgi:DNA-binding NarL/FixJ family response regulator
MTKMPPTENRSAVIGLTGPLRSILIPESLGFENPRELGRAMVAWKYDLSRQEVQLLELIAEGLTNVEIAERMSVAEENTIKQRLKVLFRKLGVRHRVQTANIAARFGIGGEFG